VVQSYLSDLEASCTVPRARLVHFERIALAPGEKQAVGCSLTRRTLSLIDDGGRRVYEPGAFRIAVGGCAPCERAGKPGVPGLVDAEFRAGGEREEMEY
jgi:beta-glucosidase